jgi:hypothetical protein
MTTTKRHLKNYTIKEIRDIRDDHFEVTTTESTGFTAEHTHLTRQLQSGDEFILETKNFSTITGMYIPRFADWAWRKTDQDLADEHAQWLADWQEKKRKLLEENWEGWKARQDALPTHYRERLEKFHEKGGGEFRLDGWSYELVICELAVMYERTNCAESEEIDAYARKYGTSGNQHDVAKAMAKHLDEFTPKEFPAGMAPLTGSADYS